MQPFAVDHVAVFECCTDSGLAGWDWRRLEAADGTGVE
jgi:hypothetical protein